MKNNLKQADKSLLKWYKTLLGEKNGLIAFDNLIQFRSKINALKSIPANSLVNPQDELRDLIQVQSNEVQKF